jgi:hypothetical protein
MFRSDRKTLSRASPPFQTHFLWDALNPNAGVNLELMGFRNDRLEPHRLLKMQGTAPKKYPKPNGENEG